MKKTGRVKVVLCLCAAAGCAAGKEAVSGISAALPLVGLETVSLETNKERMPHAEEWNLILVNRWNPIPEDYEVELVQLMGGHRVDERIYPALQQMMDAARGEGILPMISSSYRTEEEQKALLEEKTEEFTEQGYEMAQAEELARLWVAEPGTSEHQIGMAVDITTADWSQQDASVVWAWLEENAHEYGFILRYPDDKTELTGVAPEPWHYRYVGIENAAEIKERGICLEEYLQNGLY